jgi:pimeloyl-ACP methyl ester carboxylesterase
MIAHTLKATGRSLLFSAGRAGVRVGSIVTPQRTARHVARRFFTTDRPAAERRRFAAEPPHISTLALPDGTAVVYRWGDTVTAPTVVLVHGWNGWAQQLERFVEPLRARGYAVLAFDHIAHGASAGEQATLPMMIRSVRAVLDEVRSPAGVIAHSLGAAAVAGVLGRIDERRTSKPMAVVVGVEPGDLVGAQQRAGSMQRVSIGHSVSVSNSRNSPKVAGHSVGRRRTGRHVEHQVLDAHAPVPGRYTPGSIDVIMPGSIAMCGSGRCGADALRAFVHVEEVADAVAGAVAEVDALAHSGARASASSIGLRVPRGKRAATARSCP